jgi:hypothetical protein
MIEGLKGKGIATYYAGDFDKTINILYSILEIKPDFAEGWYNKSIVLGDLGC